MGDKQTPWWKWPKRWGNNYFPWYRIAWNAVCCLLIVPGLLLAAMGAYLSHGREGAERVLELL